LLTLADRLASGDEDETALEHLVQGREGLVRWLAVCEDALSGEDVETVRRLVAMDAELVETLERRRTAVLGRLQASEETRRSLAAYRGAPQCGARYVERIG